MREEIQGGARVASSSLGNTYVELHRKFREPSGSREEGIEESFWAEYLASKTKPLSWEEVEALDMAVILGEPRSGKTEEFQQRAKYHQGGDPVGFFLRLDELISHDTDYCVQVSDRARLERWRKGRHFAYFYLDSVDESRLTDPAALSPLLRKFANSVGPLQRARVFVSSRKSDWQLATVRKALTELNTAIQLARHGATPGPEDAIQRSPPDDQGETSPPVYELAPLDPVAVRCLARGFGVADADRFWEAISAGGYKEYAEKPGDLLWLTQRWKKDGELGDNRDLIENAIAVGLTELNQKYIDANAAIEPYHLREAAEALAAAVVFSGRPLIQFSDEQSAPGLVAAGDVLDYLKPQDRQRVLGASIFDVPSLDRVRFRIRAVREYLAACWVAREMKKGLAATHALSLFVDAAHGEPVLIKSRRGVLCWLATSNAPARDYVIENFPELVTYEGDPTKWARSEVIEAFHGYLRKLSEGFSQDWWNEPSELARLSRTLTTEVLMEAIQRHRDTPRVLSRVLSLVSLGGRKECAKAIFGLYREHPSMRARQDALWVLSDVATSDQRAAIRAQLLANELENNELRAAALAAVGVASLTRAELAAVLRAAEESPAYHTDELSRTISDTLAPELEYPQARTLLEAIRDAVPPNPKDWGYEHGEERKGFAWLLGVYGSVLNRVLATLPAAVVPDADLIDLICVAEELHDRSFLDRDELSEMQAALNRHPAARKQVALRLALTEKNQGWLHSPLTTSTRALVRLELSDLDWIYPAAMRDDEAPASRRTWFVAAVDLVDAAFEGSERDRRLLEMAAAVDTAERKLHLAKIEAQREINKAQQAKHREEEITEEAAEESRRQRWVASLIKVIPGIRAGSHAGALAELLNSARRQGAEFENVDPDQVLPEAGAEVTEAFRTGFPLAFKVLPVPDLVKYVGKSEVPWIGIIGMASANFALRHGLDAAGAGQDEVVRAMQFAPWSHRDPEPWVEDSAARHGVAIAKVLRPVLEAELIADSEGHNSRTTSLVLKSPGLQEHLLEAAARMLQDRKVAAEYHERQLCNVMRGHPRYRSTVAAVARARLATSLRQPTPSLGGIWLGEWLHVDLAGAWKWVRSLSPKPFRSKAVLARELAVGAGDFERWASNLPATAENVQVLVEMFRFVDEQYPLSQGKEEKEDHPYQFLKRVPGVLQSLGTTEAHGALLALAKLYAGSHDGIWLRNLAMDLAAAIAESRSVVEPRDLRDAYEAYTRVARTEGELLTQVMARLGEIRSKIETGRHSDRILFHSKTKEEVLQLYLAARLEDTPGRTFSAQARFAQVTREPQADLRNKPDIEVAVSAGRVVIEVKPVSRDHKYTPSYLAGTLRKQIVEKYLVRGGSKHGILVVMSVGPKTWRIPKGRQRGTFGDLLTYLAAQAKEVRNTSAGAVEELLVLGIDCVPPPKLPAQLYRKPPRQAKPARQVPRTRTRRQR